MQLDSFLLVPGALVLACSYFFLKWFHATTHQLKHIPTIGHSGVLTSYIDAFRFFSRGHEMIQDGYNRHYGSAFKVPTLFKWIVIVSGQQLIDDIRRAPDDQLSFEEFVAETLQMEYTLGPGVRRDTYHINVIRTPLTKNIAPQFSVITDEIATAFKELVPAISSDWISVPALKAITKVICRTTNRYLVGLPLARNADFTDLIEKFTLDIYLGGQIISLFPTILKPLAARVFTRVPSDIEQFTAHLRPVVETELRKANQGEKNENVVSWLLEEAAAQDLTPSVLDIAVRVLAINFVAIHTASNALTHALYYLAAYPQYADPMREEVQAIMDSNSEELSREALANMHKLDSFLKETQRLSMGAFAISRKAMKDFTFSNGLFLPKGTEVAIATYATQTDEASAWPGKNYVDPLTFKPFRFCESRGPANAGGTESDFNAQKHSDLISPSPTYLSFGSGRHACPGRFFAATELKAAFVHILLNYDVKLPKDGSHPPDNVWFGGAVVPHQRAQVMFRRRR
ncbi:hypothetical protein CVT26_012611 [Gymnopilus dilepis]|uniref:Cytochrome P450 n=1 Tax=Gymnopilus dilepis TaxID=231916 RepID=A0A409YVZ3_9AGAR|nr:hypothetical protein CVT26_012611 [Gymnopilus dilepis]